MPPVRPVDPEFVRAWEEHLAAALPGATPEDRTPAAATVVGGAGGPTDVGRHLATVHAAAVGFDRQPQAGRRLADVAEAPREGDWTLRSALVRYAQREPVRAGAVLELVRRVDGALHPHRRLLEGTEVVVHGSVGPDRLHRSAHGTLLTGWETARRDARAAELGVVAHRWPDGLDEVVAGYRDVAALDPEEEALIGVLGVASVLDDIGEALAGWAVDIRSRPPPHTVIDDLARHAHAWLAALGVEREARPPRRA